MKAYTPEKVREIEEMLKEVKAWHQGDHFRFGDSEQRESWVSHKEGIETALATLRSGQEVAQQAQPEPDIHLDLSKVYPEWQAGASVFKDWCGNYFGPDSDEEYLAKAVLALPRVAQPPAAPQPKDMK